jgi:hypothetical protein
VHCACARSGTGGHGLEGAEALLGELEGGGRVAQPGERQPRLVGTVSSGPRGGGAVSESVNGDAPSPAQAAPAPSPSQTLRSASASTAECRHGIRREESQGWRRRRACTCSGTTIACAFQASSRPPRGDLGIGRSLALVWETN